MTPMEMMKKQRLQTALNRFRRANSAFMELDFRRDGMVKISDVMLEFDLAASDLALKVEELDSDGSLHFGHPPNANSTDELETCSKRTH